MVSFSGPFLADFVRGLRLPFVEGFDLSLAIDPFEPE
jgi:hypothetical protein